MRQFIILGIAIGIFSVGELMSKNYYFANDGSDNRTFVQARNPATPWKTIEKLNAINKDLVPGDTVFLKRGDRFFGQLLLSSSGVNGIPIVYAAYGDGPPPIITSFKKITAWEALDNGKFSSPELGTNAPTNLLMVDGQPYPKGRYPNLDAPNNGYLTVSEAGNGFITDPMLPANIAVRDAEIVMRSERWILDVAPIIAQSKQTIYYDITGLDYQPARGKGFFVQNSVHCLDQFGEWCVDPIYKKITIFLRDALPESVDIEIPMAENLVTIQGNNLVMQDLMLTGANQNLIFGDDQGIKNFTLTHCHLSFAGRDAVHIPFGHQVKVMHTTINQAYNNGIFLGYNCHHCETSYNQLSYIGHVPGMGLRGDGNYIGIFNRHSGFTAKRNKIQNIGYSALDFGGDSAQIVQNYVDQFCTVKDDGAGIYTYNGPTNTTFKQQQIIGNIVVNGIGAPHGTKDLSYRPAEGIYLDDNSNHVIVADNTIASCSNYGIFVHNARNFIIRNNLVFDNLVQFGTMDDELGDPISGGVIERNTFCTKAANNNLSYLTTTKDNLSAIGIFKNNLYVNPLNDGFSIATEIFSESLLSIFRIYDLMNWQKSSRQDVGSKNSPWVLKPNEVLAETSANLLEHGHFSNEALEQNCWSEKADCEAMVRPQPNLEGNALRIRQGSPAELLLGLFAVKKETFYQLKFDAFAQRQSSIAIALRQQGEPFLALSDQKYVQISPNKQSYEILLQARALDSQTQVRFKAGESDFEYWIDNISLKAVEVKPVVLDDMIRLAFNASAKDTIIQLPVPYLDVDQIPYTKEVRLKPFESILLFKEAFFVGN